MTYHPVKFDDILPVAVEQRHMTLHGLAERVYVFIMCSMHDNMFYSHDNIMR